MTDQIGEPEEVEGDQDINSVTIIQETDGSWRVVSRSGEILEAGYDASLDEAKPAEPKTNEP